VGVCDAFGITQIPVLGTQSETFHSSFNPRTMFKKIFYPSTSVGASKKLILILVIPTLLLTSCFILVNKVFADNDNAIEPECAIEDCDGSAEICVDDYDLDYAEAGYPMDVGYGNCCGDDTDEYYYSGYGCAKIISSCGTTITESGTYVLASNLNWTSSGFCITISAGNVVFDGRGYGIYGSGDGGASDGVLASGSGITIKNLTLNRMGGFNGAIRVTGRATIDSCNLNSWTDTVYLTGANSSVVKNSTFTSSNPSSSASSGNYGIRIINTDNTTIRNNTMGSNVSVGVEIVGSSNTNKIELNKGSGSVKAISLDQDLESPPIPTSNYGCSNTISGGCDGCADNGNNINICSNSSCTSMCSIKSCGITLTKSGTYVVANNLTYSGSGCCITISANSVILNGNSKSITGSNQGTGVCVESSNNEVKSFSNIQNLNYGISIDSGTGNDIYSNTITNNNNQGIEVRSNSNNIYSNTSSNNNDSGIYVVSNSNTIHSNTCSNNSTGLFFSNADSNNIYSNIGSGNSSQYGLVLISGAENNYGCANTVTGTIDVCSGCDVTNNPVNICSNSSSPCTSYCDDYIPPEPEDPDDPVVDDFDIDGSVTAFSTCESDVDVNWEVSDTGGSELDQVEVWQKVDGGAWSEIVACRDTSVSGNGPETGTCNVNLTCGSVYEFGIHVIDGAGNQGTEDDTITVTASCVPANPTTQQEFGFKQLKVINFG